jgi:hypothetical protein
MAEISINSSAPNVNIGNNKSSKENNSTIATHTGQNQPSAMAEISISSSAPNVYIGNYKSSKDNNSTLATHVGRNQPFAMAIPTSISSRHAKIHGSQCQHWRQQEKQGQQQRKQKQGKSID